MIGFIALPLAALAAYALGGLTYLRRTLLPVAPATTPVAAPYTPPFQGGQCVGVAYNFQFTVNYTFQGANYSQFYSRVGQPGKLRLDVFPDGAGMVRNIGNGIEGFTGIGRNPAYSNVTVSGLSVTPTTAGTDTCGNTPNPNPTLPIGGDGVASSPAPNIEADGLKVIEGSPIVAVPNFAAALAAALAAARAAANALDAIKSIADAIEALTDLFKKLKDQLDGKDEEEDDKAKSVYRYDFGSISRDGFRRLYPDANTSKLRCSYIDLQVLSIPIGYGKYFGNFSPNFYRYKSLGYISFVSPTFGIMKTHEIEFSRMSLECPENAFGFFFHLGLDGAIVANASAFYVKKELPV